MRTPPAHKAFLERSATQEIESREVTPTPSHDYPLSVSGDKFYYSQASYSRAPSEALSETDTDIADPEDIERAVKSSQRSTQTINTSRDPAHLVPLKDPFFEADSNEDEQGYHTYPSPVLGSREFSIPGSVVGSPVSRSFIADIEIHFPPSSPAQYASEKPRPDPVTPGPVLSNVAKVQPGNTQDFPSTQTVKQADSQTPTPLKRKSDNMTGNTVINPGSPKKTSIAPAERTQKFENDKAAAKIELLLRRESERSSRRDLWQPEN